MEYIELKAKVSGDKQNNSIVTVTVNFIGNDLDARLRLKRHLDIALRNIERNIFAQKENSTKPVTRSTPFNGSFHKLGGIE